MNLDNLGGYQQSANKLDAVPQVTQNENSVYAGAGVYPLEGGYIYINVIQVSRFLRGASDHVKSSEVIIRCVRRHDIKASFNLCRNGLAN